TWASLHKGEFELMQFNTFYTQTHFPEFMIVVFICHSASQTLHISPERESEVSITTRADVQQVPTKSTQIL
ncbi:MAG: hypothetical protein ACRC6N_07415, partial [Plesiomonas sp.]|uniref:hypothetical protein n=1 Tax=Plesiomonas sp. TaxID=2486279 RepID=UPI003F3C2E59